MVRITSLCVAFFIFISSVAMAQDQTLEKKRSKEIDDFYAAVSFDQPAWIKATPAERAKMEADNHAKHEELARTNYFAARELSVHYMRKHTSEGIKRAIEVVKASKPLAISAKEKEELEGEEKALGLMYALALVKEASKK